MKIKFNNGFKIYPKVYQDKYFFLQKQKEVSHLLSCCIARIKQRELIQNFKSQGGYTK